VWAASCASFSLPRICRLSCATGARPFVHASFEKKEKVVLQRIQPRTRTGLLLASRATLRSLAAELAYPGTPRQYKTVSSEPATDVARSALKREQFHRQLPALHE
jgi:hypothetical protein